MDSEMIAYVAGNFESAAGSFRKDLDALNHEDLERKWGESSRCAYDFIYEVSLLHKRSAMKLRGEDPGPLPWNFGEEWLRAPEEIRSHDKATAYFDEASRELLDTVKAKSESADAEESMKLFKALDFATLHTSYHDAQLNFIQAFKGDLAIHW